MNHRLLSRFATPMVLAASLAFALSAGAQSSADKATARRLANDGIELFQKGQVAEALDKLERAEQLFDAPVHLVYIARCQVKLGKLVEAAESYRKLVNSSLPAGAPQVFRDAMTEGQTELAELEPKIPMLTIDVVPSVQGVTLKIDGESVSSAALGVERPTNPGRHNVDLTAPGYRTARSSVDVRIGGKQQLRLELERGSELAAAGADAAVAPGATGLRAADPGSPASRTDSGAPAAAGASTAPQRLAIHVGLRLLGAAPGGRVVKGDGVEQPMSDRLKTGAGGELLLGLAIPLGKLRVTPLLSVEQLSFQPGSYYQQPVSNIVPGGLPTSGGQTDLVVTPSMRSFGFGGAVEFGARSAGSFGGFAEVVFQPAHQLTIEGTIKQGLAECTYKETYGGSGGRLGVGGIYSLSRIFRLTAQLGIGMGTFSSRTLKVGGCPRLLAKDIDSFASDDKASHSVISFGVGGEARFGL